jgi:hypothetical protein
MARTNALIPVRYSDFEKKIYLTSYADTIVLDGSGRKLTLCAIRFGGYSEQVEAMALAINGGGSLELELDGQQISLSAPAKRFRKQLAHDGVYAEATLTAMDDLQQAENSKSDENSDDTEDEPDVPIVQELPQRESYIYTAVGDRTALFDAIDRAVSVPLIPEFQEYVIEELQSKGFLRPLRVHSVSLKFDAWKLKCTASDRNIIEIVERGLRERKIAIPGADAAKPMAKVDTVTEYLAAFGNRGGDGGIARGPKTARQGKDVQHHTLPRARRGQVAPRNRRIPRRHDRRNRQQFAGA